MNYLFTHSVWKRYLSVFLFSFLLLITSRLAAQDDPSSFSSSVIDAEGITLSYADNAAGDDVMIAFSTSATFGTPVNGNTYAVDDVLAGGGTILYNGADLTGIYNHTSLTANTAYYYKIWSVDGSNNYSTGLTDNSTTAKYEPTYHATGFDTSSVGETSISLSWADAVGTVLPDGYLIKGSTTSLAAITDPSDGTAEADGGLVFNVTHGTQLHTFNSLSANTDYYFKIYSYTNSGTLIDYKTDPTIPNVSTTTDPTPASLSLSDNTINEGSINSGVITVTLSNDTYEASLNTANWTVNNLPDGITKGTLTRTGSTTATIALNGTRTVDFDSDITNVEVVVTGAEFVLNKNGASANTGVTIIASNDSETLAISGSATEGSENSATVTVTLSGGTFASSLSAGNWSLTNAPEGVSVGGVVRDNSTQATLTLSGNRTEDYDSDITNMTVTAGAAEIDDTGSGVTSATGFTFTASNDAESISIADDGTITETSENGEVITVTVSGGTFASSLTPGNWTVSNLPTGVSAGNPVRTSATTATITLSGNRTVDYDSDITNLTVSVTQDEVDDYTGSDLSDNSGVTFTASNDAESISTAWAASPGTNGAEATLDDDVVRVTLSGGTFISGQINTTNITLSGDATTTAGVSIESASYVDATTVDVALAWDGTDYDTDKTLTVNVAQAAFDESDALINDNITLTATDEPASIAISDDGSIAEAAENGEVITVTLSEDDFVAVLTPGNWTVSNLPTGVSAGNPVRTSATTATITLSGNRTVDYDSDITNVTVEVQGAEFETHSNTASANSGVTLTASNDAESISIADDVDEITEGAENGEEITVTLTGGTFASSLTPGNWSLSNGPAGVSIGSISRDDATTATITLSGNRTTDYDANITNLVVSAAASEIDDNGSLISSDGTGVVFNATSESLAISHAGLVENTLDGSVVNLTLTNETFADGTLSAGNFTLNNAPTGTSINSVGYTNSTQATVTLDFDGTDFDAAVSNFNITVDAAELTGSGDLTSNNLTISAIDDAESISIADDVDEITEGAEDGEVITVTLSGGTFASTLTPGNWTVNNLPGGVSAGNPVRTSATTATITLSGNRTEDYDANITNLEVSISDAEVDDYSGVNLSANSGVVFNASDDAESISIADDGTITEASENGEVITVTVSGGTFASSLTPGNWTVSNLPTGVSAGNPVRTSATTATITLSGNRTVDYDSDITNLTVSVTQDEVDDYTGADLSDNSGVTFTASNDAESISTAWAASPGTNGAEATLDDDVVRVTLSGGTFISGQINTTNITLSGDATTTAGVSIESASYVDATTVDVALAWDGTDYDTDKTLTVNVAQAAFDESDALISDNITLTATDEPASIAISDDGSIAEAAENGEVITVTLSEDDFVAVLTPGNWTVSNLPTGVSAGNPVRTSATTATITLSGNRTVDYDSDITNVTVEVQGAEFETHSNTASANSGVTLTASNDAESISIADDVDEITEGAENGEEITVTLTGGTFASSLTPGNWSLSNGPAGVSIGSISRDDATTATITLSGNRTTDYDANITNLVVSAAASEIDDNGSLISSDGTGVVFNATSESLAISHAGLVENTLDGSVVNLTLTNETFADGTLSAGNFTLNNAPTGTSINSVGYTNSTQATVTLDFDGTDFDAAVSNFSITVAAAELSGMGDITSNTLSISAINDMESVSLAWGNPPNTGGAEATMDDEIVQITLSGGTFISGQITTGNITASGTATSDAGVSIESVSYVDATHVNVNLAWDGTDFDTDKTLTLQVATAAFNASDAAISNDITLTATDEGAESISIADDGSIAEGAEDGEVITITLSNGSYANSLNTANWTVNNLPDGVSKGTLTRVSATSATIALSGNRTVDYDSDITNVEVVVTADEIFDYSGADISDNSGVTLTATNDAESISAAWGNPPNTGGVEATMDDEIVQITLSGGTFISGQINLTNITADGDATTTAGVSLESVSYVDATHINVSLAWDGTDFDTDKTLNLYVEGAGYDDGSTQLSTSITLTATAEAVLTLSTSALTHFGNVQTGNNSSEQSYTISGSNLTSNVTLTPPTGWEISTGTGGSFVAENPLTLTPTGGTLSLTSIYVRFSPSTTGPQSGNITHATTGHTTENVAVEGYGTDAGASADVVITEVADYYGNSARDYVEIFNNGNAMADLDGWTLTERYTTGSSSRSITLNSSSQKNSGGSNYLLLEPGEFAVVVFSDWSGLKSAHSISNEVAIFSNSSVCVIDGDERYQLESGAKAVIDNFGDWDNASNFSATGNKSYERNNSGSDGELESAWTISSSPSYGYTPGTLNDNPLPIELLSYTANYDEDKVEIEWVTLTEFNNDYFTLEKSYNGIEFFPLLTVGSKGNSNLTQRYRVMDYEEPKGKVYYKLSQTDMDGTITELGICVVELEERTALAIQNAYYQNEQLYIDYSAPERGNALLEIYSMQGQLLYQQKIFADAEQNRLVLSDARFNRQVLIIRIATRDEASQRKLIR